MMLWNIPIMIMYIITNSLKNKHRIYLFRLRRAYKLTRQDVCNSYIHTWSFSAVCHSLTNTLFYALSVTHSCDERPSANSFEDCYSAQSWWKRYKTELCMCQIMNTKCIYNLGNCAKLRTLWEFMRYLFALYRKNARKLQLLQGQSNNHNSL